MPLTSEEIVTFYREHGVEPGDKVAIGVSGGADSLCLLLLSASLYQVTAITVDHALRADSADEALFVSQLCARHGINHTILLWEGEKPTSNIQAEARAARYHLMKQWCVENSFSYLAIAHHRDDQAETLLLRLARGSGVYGLAAMPSVRDIGDGVSILRPLLSVPKATLIETLQSIEQPWIEDPSNKSTTYDRVKVREFLANPPLEGLNAERLSSTADRLRRSRDALEHYECRWLGHAVSVYDGGYFTLRIDQLRSEPEEIVLRGLASLCRFFNSSGYVPRMEKLLRLRDSLLSNDFSGHTLYGAQFSFLKSGNILISRELSVVESRIPLKESVIWDNRFAITAKGGISGLEIGSLGVDGWSELKKKLPDFDQTVIPRQAGLVLPAIYRDTELQVVPHLGYNVLEGLEIQMSLKRDILTKK